MKRSILFIVFFVRFFVTEAGAQAIDNMLAYKNICQEQYLRINYENDFFSGTDIYYTQGILVEAVSPVFKKNPLSKLLIRPHFSYIRVGLGIEHDGYTPTSYSNPAILYGDRPYAASLMLKTFVMAKDPIKKQRFSTTLSLGVVGQAAGGAEMQTGIHHWLHDVLPRGWSHQIHNDAIVNYQVDYEKQFVVAGKYFLCDADAVGYAGTLSDKVCLGTTIMFGYFYSPFETALADKNPFRIYAYEHPQVNAIGYDATLEGGMFNRTSPYTINAANVTRFTFQNRFGFVVEYHRIFLEYFQSVLSSEFKAGNFHVWGGVQVAFKI